ncbi:MAG: phage major capsid protein [Candidatus Babeliales bacterium]
MPSPNISEIITTTIENRSGVLADNFTTNNAILMKMKEGDRVKPVNGGYEIRQELAYAANSTAMRYSGYQTLDISPQDVFTSAAFNIKQYAVAVSISGLEMLQNTGQEAIIDLLESRIENAEGSLMNLISTDMYGDGTAGGGKAIDGLNALVSATPTTGTVGGINAATWSFWQNYLYDFSDLSITPSATTIQAAMNAAFLGTARGRDQVDLIIADNTYYTYYWSSLQGIQRIMDDKKASAGYTTLKFMGADVVFDGGVGGGCPANTMFFLNTKYLYFRPHKDRNFVALDPDRFATNQDAMVKMIAWAGNMTASNRKLQGRIQN